ncbi:nuclear transport factor 2 family protein [Gramella sp. GC03-9]|uniref:Nuclear transport factor 2 family protein n=1 Tax=Christiangramia oceanisediminis TaxID=2920386 RepID=A0A9X2R8N2_9FLAO|nr:nuclear transport factor 2 family protein [Gramella oceanisediminis]MCP9200393.1 nuclear transport factor 2 family protein [Gramella oceanisediminis]
MKNREKLMTKINKAFAEGDAEFISNSVTDDIKWVIVGEKTISGKTEFEASLDRMKLGGPLEIIVKNVINEKEKCVVEGIVEMKLEPAKAKKYAFCDIYIFPDEVSNKFRELRTYVSPIRDKLSI